MNGNGNGPRLTDAIVITLFVLFLMGGGYFAWRAVEALSDLNFDKIDVTIEMKHWEKSVNDKIEGFMKSLEPKPAEPTNPEGPVAVPPSSGSKAMVKKAELKTIKLFEAGKEIPAVRSRVYAAQFSRQARLIYVEISYKNNNYKVADTTLPVVLQYYGPSGNLLAELKAAAQPKKEWASALYTRGWGPPDGNPWQVGTYTVKVILDGEPAGEGTFHIRDNGPII